MRSQVSLLLVIVIHTIFQSSGFLICSTFGRSHKSSTTMMLSESPQDTACVGDVDAKMEDTYASLVERTISRYERQSAANELKNNQLFIGKIT